MQMEGWLLIKESHPIQVVKCAIAQGIQYEPAFNWWVFHVLKEKDRIIFMVKECSAQYLKRTHKFGFKLPKTVKEATVTNGNKLWQHAIQKQMENVKVTFQTIPESEKAPNGFQYFDCCMVSDIKMENL